MRYLNSRKRRFCYLAMLIVLSLVWPFLSVPDLDVKEFFLYVTGLVVPAIPLFFIRKRIVSFLHRFSKIIFCKWLRGVATSFIATWVLFRMGFVIDSFIHEKNIGQLILLYIALIPAIGAYGFSIKKRHLPVLAIMAVFLLEWNTLSGVTLSLLISAVVLPNKYPLTLEELLASTEVTEDEESDCLYFFVQTARNDTVIPTLEDYVSRAKNKFLGYHYLLHMSHTLENDDAFRHRVLEAERMLGIPEIEILFPMPRFRNPEEE